METSDVVRARVREVLKLRGITPYQVSVSAGRNPSWLSDLLSGKRRGLTSDTLDDLSRALGIPVNLLVTPLPEHSEQI